MKFDDNMELIYEIVFFVLCGSLLLVHLFCSCIFPRRQKTNAQQSSEVWNISGRVAQDGVMAPDSQRWPTHDHRLSIDSFVLANSVHISQKNQIPPPLYCEVDLPTYEQATGASLPKTDVPTVHISSSSSRNLDHSTS